MPSVTLAESAKLTQDQLLAGLIEDVIRFNPMFELMTFLPIEGNSLAYNRENVQGDVQSVGVGDNITARAAATFTKVTSALTTLIGDAEVNGLIQATRSSVNDQTAVQVRSKMKSIAQEYQDQMINGDGTSDDITGLLALVDGSQTIVQDTSGSETNGGPLSFEKLDELIDLVKDKNGQVDYLMMHPRSVRSLKTLLRNQPGAGLVETRELPSGNTIFMYGEVPIFKNDYLPVNQTIGSLSSATAVLAGTFDDGSQSTGIAGLTARDAAGIQVEFVGAHQSKDEAIWRARLLLMHSKQKSVLMFC